MSKPETRRTGAGMANAEAYAHWLAKQARGLNSVEDVEVRKMVNKHSSVDSYELLITLKADRLQADLMQFAVATGHELHALKDVTPSGRISGKYATVYHLGPIWEAVTAHNGP